LRRLDKALLAVSIFLMLSSVLAIYMVLIPVIYLGYSLSYGIALFIPFIFGMWLNLFLKRVLGMPTEHFQ